MPSLSFVLPHWLYWATLLIFPLIAMYLMSRQQRHPPDQRPTLFIAYLFWFLSGYLGIHRFYLRSAWGVIFIPVFLIIIYCNTQIRDVRDDESRTFAAMEQAQSAVERARPRGGVEPTPESKAELERAQAELKKADSEYQTAKAIRDEWKNRARIAAIVLAVLLLIDAALLPGLVRRRRALETAKASTEPIHEEAVAAVHEGGVGQDPTLAVHSTLTDLIDGITTKVGLYVAWWAVIAVFAYYYEVVARFIFNSPTNWVHESMFLMFGMQYVLCGAYAYCEDQHVRVDVIYTKFSTRGKAIADIITSVFFFVFMVTLLLTSYRFASDAISVGEVSFTEWGIQYWPVKLMMPIGAALMVLQGVSKLIKDVMIVTRKAA
jgi:TRAP-type mannitol/chloroaromatic compound transport system permease small subunit